VPAPLQLPFQLGPVLLLLVKLIVHVTGSEFPSKLTISELSCSRFCAEILRPSFVVTPRFAMPAPFGT
jgi:hypothetical protein